MTGGGSYSIRHRDAAHGRTLRWTTSRHERRSRWEVILVIVDTHHFTLRGDAIPTMPPGLDAGAITSERDDGDDHEALPDEPRIVETIATLHHAAPQPSVPTVA